MGKSQLSGCQLRIMGKVKYRDANSELWGKSQNTGMQTQNYGENVKISGCKLRIMGKKSNYRDGNSEIHYLWGKTQNIGMQTQNYGGKTQNIGMQTQNYGEKIKI